MGDERILRARVIRKQSPDVEMYIQDQIADGIKELLTEKGLYQKTVINPSKLTEYSKSNKLYESENYSTSDLKIEFSKRPWLPECQYVDIHSSARRPSLRPLITDSISDPSQLPLYFHLPTLELWCGRCKRHTAQLPSPASICDLPDSKFPHSTEEAIHQQFNIFYLCESCRLLPVQYLVLRDGYKLMLCGRTEPNQKKVDDIVPDDLRNILSDALSAVSEGDIHAGIYHIRTFCEHYMKKTLQLSYDTQVRGDELADHYSSTLTLQQRETAPSLKSAYDKLSQLMHSRCGNADDFKHQMSEIIRHLKLKELLTKR